MTTRLGSLSGPTSMGVKRSGVVLGRSCMGNQFSVNVRGQFNYKSGLHTFHYGATLRKRSKASFPHNGTHMFGMGQKLTSRLLIELVRARTNEVDRLCLAPTYWCRRSAYPAATQRISPRWQ